MSNQCRYDTCLVAWLQLLLVTSRKLFYPGILRSFPEESTCLMHWQLGIHWIANSIYPLCEKRDGWYKLTTMGVFYMNANRQNVAINFTHHLKGWNLSYQSVCTVAFPFGNADYHDGVTGGRLTLHERLPSAQIHLWWWNGGNECKVLQTTPKLISKSKGRKLSLFRIILSEKSGAFLMRTFFCILWKAQMSDCIPWVHWTVGDQALLPIT